MELRNLKTFLQVVESGSFTGAAEVLGYTQATVSFQINQLEEELGCKLFDRIGKNIYLTSRGELLQEHSLSIRNSVDRLKEAFVTSEKPSGTVRMHSSDSICERMMLLNYAEFYSNYPDIHLVFSTGSTLDLLQSLERNEADAIFTLDNHVYRQNFKIARESPVRMIFVCGPENPISKKEKIELEDILKEPLVLTEKGMSYRKVFDDYLSQLSLEVDPVLETGRTDIIIKCIAEGMGVSLLPEFVVKEGIANGKLCYLDVENFELTIWKQLIYRKDKWISSALQAFLEFVVAHEFEW